MIKQLNCRLLAPSIAHFSGIGRMKRGDRKIRNPILGSSEDRFWEIDGLLVIIDVAEHCAAPIKEKYNKSINLQ